MKGKIKDVPSEDLPDNLTILQYQVKKQQCARYTCDNLFVPKSVNHRFCCTSCQQSAEDEKRILSALTEEPDPAVVAAATNELVKDYRRQMGIVERLLLKSETRTAVILNTVTEHLDGKPLRFESSQPRKKWKEGQGPSVDAHFMFSDPQGGKFENEIGLKVLLDEYMPMLAEKIMRCIEVQRAEGPVDHLYLHMLGDLVEGCMIFAGQRSSLDRHFKGESSIHQVLVMADAISSVFLAQLRPNFKRMTVASADGNHGRTGTKTDPSVPYDNMDRLVAEICKRMTSNLDIEWVLPEGDRYRIESKGWNLGGLHGHQFGSKNSLNAMELPVLRWDATQYFGKPLDALLMGHRHHPASLDMQGIELIQNGAIDGGSEWLRKTGGQWSSPSQELFFVSREFGIGTRRRLYVTPRQPRAELYAA